MVALRSFSNLSAALTAAIVLALLPAPLDAARREALTGPVDAVVLRVIDGDTLIADARIWPGQTIRVSVRVRGIDAPELRSRCASERAAALEAREAFAGLVASGKVRLSNIGGGKYYGRVLADIETADGVPVGPRLLSRNLVRAYRGGKRRGWCG